MGLDNVAWCLGLKTERMNNGFICMLNMCIWKSPLIMKAAYQRVKNSIAIKISRASRAEQQSRGAEIERDSSRAAEHCSRATWTEQMSREPEIAEQTSAEQSRAEQSNGAEQGNRGSEIAEVADTAEIAEMAEQHSNKA